VDESALRSELEQLQRSPRQEVVWREDFGRDGQERVMALARSMGFHAKSYGGGRARVTCASKVPLPDEPPHIPMHQPPAKLSPKPTGPAARLPRGPRRAVRHAGVGRLALRRRAGAPAG
jgi:hypothetical protein